MDAIGRRSVGGSTGEKADSGSTHSDIGGDNDSKGVEPTHGDNGASSPGSFSAAAALAGQDSTASPPITGDNGTDASPANAADGSMVVGTARSVTSNDLPTKATPTAMNSLVRVPRPLSAFPAPSLADTDEQSEASISDEVGGGLSAHLAQGETVGREGVVAAGRGEGLYRLPQSTLLRRSLEITHVFVHRFVTNSPLAGFMRYLGTLQTGAILNTTLRNMQKFAS